jgi:hypothetical protein
MDMLSGSVRLAVRGGVSWAGLELEDRVGLLIVESYLGWLVWSLRVFECVIVSCCDFFIFWGVEMIMGSFSCLVFFLTSNARITKVLGKGGVQANTYIVVDVLLLSLLLWKMGLAYFRLDLHQEWSGVGSGFDGIL